MEITIIVLIVLAIYNRWQIMKLNDKVDLLERAMHAGMKEPAKKSKKKTLVEVVKEADNE